jgi:hypothetical protein
MRLLPAWGWAIAAVGQAFVTSGARIPQLRDIAVGPQHLERDEPLEPTIEAATT